jgi:nucleoside-triphosphatase
VANKLLLTGKPGCGKTTVIRRTVELLQDHRLAGFYAQEIRRHGGRTGFRALGLSGASAVLAHTDFRGSHRVGRYGVDIEAFEQLVSEEILEAENEVDLFVIDEIGKMECFSDVFVDAVTRILDSETQLLATVSVRGGGLISVVKSRSDVEILEVSTNSRDRLPAELVRRFARAR